MYGVGDGQVLRGLSGMIKSQALTENEIEKVTVLEIGRFLAKHIADRRRDEDHLKRKSAKLFNHPDMG